MVFMYLCMIFIHDIYEFISYLFYRKEHSKISGKCSEKIRRKYNQRKTIKLLSQIIKKKCYL